MKKHLFLGFLGALALSACSNDEPMGAGADDNKPGANEPGEAQYLTVNIVSTPASRAAGDQMTGDPDNALYEEGTATENAVSKVRFYFFNADGSAANVHHSNTTANFYDWTPEDAGQDMPNVEKQLTATIVIHTGTATDEYPTDGGVPAQMIAVLNPDVTVLGNSAKSIADLREISEDYASYIYGEDKSIFVMTNSVYKSGTLEVMATPITQTNFQATPELAKNYPVNIYVERNVAKVRVKFDREGDKVNDWAMDTKIGEGTYNLLKLKDKDGNDIKVTVNNVERQVYVRFFAWNVTATTDKAYLSKHIDTTWGDNLFGTEAWNYSPYFRSYWALNAADAKQSWISFEDIASDANPGHAFGDKGVAYINENAPQKETNATSEGADIEPFSKVIIKAQLMYFDNSNAAKSLELCKYAGLSIIGQTSLEQTLFKQLDQNGMIYRHWVDEDGTKHVQSLTIDDTAFKTAIASGETGLETEAKTGRYYVYLQTSDAFTVKEGEVWNTSADVENLTPDAKLATKAGINTYLKNQLGNAQIYNSGYTYYYFPIQHLGDADHKGYNGVVRNHIYDCVIEDLRGLGTPVFDPYEDIYPEKPKEEDVFIGAKINILSWRVVPNKIKLEW